MPFPKGDCECEGCKHCRGVFVCDGTHGTESNICDACRVARGFSKCSLCGGEITDWKSDEAGVCIPCQTTKQVAK